MLSDWVKMTWGDLATLEYGTGLRNYQTSEGLYPVFGTNGQIGWHTQPLVSGPGVIIGRKGAYRGVHFSNKPFYVIDTAFYLKPLINKFFDMKWAYYQLLDFDVNNIDSGTAIPSTSRDAFYAIPVTVPPLPTQRKIAAILSAYDDLIENNTRRIRILEQMAQILYRHWFVDFKFPGHENVRMVDSGTELGEIPEGWEVQQIGNIIEILGGGTPSTKLPEYWEKGQINWFVPKDLTASGTMFMGESPRKITEFGLQNSSARLFSPYSVMMTSRATIGVTAINTLPACTNQGFITCIPNEQLSALYIYFWIGQNLEKIIGVASGATFKEITKSIFRKLPIIVPSPQIADLFQKCLLPFGKLIEILQSKNQNLRITRDLSLPQLIIGNLDVTELDISGAE